MNEDTTAKTKIKIQPGVRIGQLKVNEKCGTAKSRYTIWRCSCDCGGEVQLDTRALQRGTITHCGCLSKLTPGQKDLTGMRFGKLVCIEPTERRGYHGGTIWICKCDCGNETVVIQSHLQIGKTQSCGCIWLDATREALKLIDGTSIAVLERMKKPSKRNTSGHTGVYYGVLY